MTPKLEHELIWVFRLLRALLIIVLIVLFVHLYHAANPLTHKTTCEGFDAVVVWSDGTHDVLAGDSNCFKTGMDDGQ